MTANALRDVKSKPSIVTPIANKISEAVLPIMQYIGMKQLDVKVAESANLRKIVFTAECFDKAPENMVAFSMLLKDALAEIIAAAGITHLEIIADKSEKDLLIDGYEQLDAMYKAALISSEDSEEKVVEEKNDEKKCKKTKNTKCTCKSKKCGLKGNN